VSGSRGALLTSVNVQLRLSATVGYTGVKEIEDILGAVIFMMVILIAEELIGEM
jgi:hypothetical protein